jgi:hypothetical protein
MMFARVIPPAVLRRVADRPAFLREVGRYVEMSDDDLLRATKSCLGNLERLDRPDGPDGSLQLVLVPELWERLRPGTRASLRRISSTLAEYNPDATRPSIFARMVTPHALADLSERAEALRDRISRTAKIDDQALVEEARFAIAGSRARDRWSPDAFVYEPGFAYRLVPAIAWRVLDRARRKRYP